MNSPASPCSGSHGFAAGHLPQLLREAGVASWGIADCTEGVSSQDTVAFRKWISEGKNAAMDYLDRYHPERSNPSLLLEGARSIICCAFAYQPPKPDAVIAAYALGSDYHEIVRSRLKNVAETIEKETGCKTRVCVDTAPLRERYWALKCGVGLRGLNCNIIVPGKGSYMFLGEIITTAALPSTPPVGHDCGNCGRCVRACPTGALRPDGTVDARKCLSYLTIEHRGPLPEGTDLHGRLYGCDTCARVCPHNAHPAECVVPELLPRPEVEAITPSAAAQLTQEQFSAIFTHSAVKRAKLAGLRRNALAILSAIKPENGDGFGQCGEK